MPIHIHIELAKGSAVVLLFLVFLSYAAKQFRFYKRSQGRPFPPGPATKSFVGNILEAVQDGAWLKFTEYKYQYGDMIFFHGLGQNILVLNSQKLIHELLDKRGNIYSHRPSFTFAGELMGLNQSVAFLEYGNEWRAHRKLAHLALSATHCGQGTMKSGIPC